MPLDLFAWQHGQCPFSVSSTYDDFVNPLFLSVHICNPPPFHRNVNPPLGLLRPSLTILLLVCVAAASLSYVIGLQKFLHPHIHPEPCLQAVKASALGPKYESSGLETLLAEPLRGEMTAKQASFKQDGWSMRYVLHGLQVCMGGKTVTSPHGMQVRMPGTMMR